MNKTKYLKSFLKEGQKRLPRKLKKKYLKKYIIGGPFLVQNLTQFLNIFDCSEVNKVYKECSNKYLNTPTEKLQLAETVVKLYSDEECQRILDESGVSPCKVTCELIDISSRKV